MATLWDGEDQLLLLDVGGSNGIGMTSLGRLGKPGPLFWPDGSVRRDEIHHTASYAASIQIRRDLFLWAPGEPDDGINSFQDPDPEYQDCATFLGTLLDRKVVERPVGVNGEGGIANEVRRDGAADSSTTLGFSNLTFVLTDAGNKTANDTVLFQAYDAPSFAFLPPADGVLTSSNDAFFALVRGSRTPLTIQVVSSTNPDTVTTSEVSVSCEPLMGPQSDCWAWPVIPCKITVISGGRCVLAVARLAGGPAAAVQVGVTDGMGETGLMVLSVGRAPTLQLLPPRNMTYLNTSMILSLLVSASRIPFQLQVLASTNSSVLRPASISTSCPTTCNGDCTCTATFPPILSPGQANVSFVVSDSANRTGIASFQYEIYDRPWIELLPLSSGALRTANDAVGVRVRGSRVPLNIQFLSTSAKSTISLADLSLICEPAMNLTKWCSDLTGTGATCTFSVKSPGKCNISAYTIPNGNASVTVGISDSYGEDSSFSFSVWQSAESTGLLIPITAGIGGGVALITVSVVVRSAFVTTENTHTFPKQVIVTILICRTKTTNSHPRRRATIVKDDSHSTSEDHLDPRAQQVQSSGLMQSDKPERPKSRYRAPPPPPPEQRTTSQKRRSTHQDARRMSASALLEDDQGGSDSFENRTEVREKYPGQGLLIVGDDVVPGSRLKTNHPGQDLLASQDELRDGRQAITLSGESGQNLLQTKGDAGVLRQIKASFGVQGQTLLPVTGEPWSETKMNNAGQDLLADAGNEADMNLRINREGGDATIIDGQGLLSTLDENATSTLQRSKESSKLQGQRATQSQNGQNLLSARYQKPQSRGFDSVSIPLAVTGQDLLTPGLLHISMDARGSNVSVVAHQQQYNFTENEFTSLDLVREDLDRDGFAGVQVLTQEELEVLRGDFFDWLEGLGTGFDRKDPTTWTDPGALPVGVIHKQGISHSQFLWDVRQNEKVIKVFAHLWGTEKLLTSFDGASFMQPPEYFPNKWRVFPHWAHVDQPAKQKGLVAIQGMVTLYNSGPDDGGLLVWKNSHLKVTDIPWAHKMASSAYNTLATETFSYIRGCKQVKTCAPAGTLILWDSRTVHCSAAPKHNRRLAEPYPRAVAYVCMAPKSRISPEELERKKKAFWDMEGHGHDPNGTDYFKNSKPTIPKRPIVSKAGLRLAGVEDYDD
ncbi:hypothetical protein HDU93_003528 [Gonapodya sp. JEL0774]|nr:hypothetical protein HDU93_003528 [Gonapodya sp. JEL0774]